MPKARSSAASARPSRSKASRFSTPAPAGKMAASSPMAAASSTSLRRARPWPRPAPAPMRRWTGSCGRKASAAATSAPARWSAHDPRGPRSPPAGGRPGLHMGGVSGQGSRSLGRLLAFGSPARPQNMPEPGQRLVQPQRNQQQLEVVALVGQSPAGVADALRLLRDAVLHRQIKRSEYDIPERKLDTVIAGVSVSVGDLRGMMPAVHLGGHEQIVQKAAFYVAAAMRKRSAYIRCRNRDEKRERTEADDAQHEKYHHVSQREIDRMGNIRVGGLQIRHPVMIRVKLPQKRERVL